MSWFLVAMRHRMFRFSPAVSASMLLPAFKGRHPESFCECEADAERSGRVFPSYDASGFTHDAKSGFSLFLQERCKRIYFVRHAEAIHNVAERESRYEPKNLVLLKEQSGHVYLDTKLTPRGIEQCAALKASIRGTSVWGFEKPLNLEAVVVSPFTRTLQTAIYTLGSPDSPQAPPFIANELCREQISEAVCDCRRTINELKQDFPGVDFSLLQDNEDTLFVTNKEAREDVKERARQFLVWLAGRPEQRIAVVTHSIFLKELLSQFADNVCASDREKIRCSWVSAEMRSILLCSHHHFPSSLSLEEEKNACKVESSRKKKKHVDPDF